MRGSRGKARVQWGAMLALECVLKIQVNMSRRQLDIKI